MKSSALERLYFMGTKKNSNVLFATGFPLCLTEVCVLQSIMIVQHRCQFIQ